MISAIVFDFDGVLADSEPLHLRSYQEVLSSMGATLPAEEYYADYLGYEDEGVFKGLSNARGWALTPPQIATLTAEKAAVMDALIGETEVLYPGAAACVERLASGWPLGIASGGLRQEIERILRRSGLQRHIRFIVAAGETPASKPAPDPYRRAAELHGKRPVNCLAVEDSRWGIQSAKDAGLWCIGITHTYPIGELMEADTIVTSLDEITPELIGSLRSG